MCEDNEEYRNYPIWSDNILKTEQTPYIIIKRSMSEKINDITVPRDKRIISDFQLSDRDYSKPLCGYSNYNNKLIIGDNVSIKMSTTFKANYKNITKNYIKLEYRKLYNDIDILSDDITFTEEHFFKIVDINDDKYRLEPFYIDNEVIRHPFYINLDRTIGVKKEHFDETELVNYWYMGRQDNSDIKFKLIYDEYYIFIRELFKSIRGTTNKKQLKRMVDKLRDNLLVPYKYFISKKEEYINNYFNVLESNGDIISEYFTDAEIDIIGTYSLYGISKNKKEGYNEIYNILEDVIDYKLNIYKYSEHHFYPAMDRQYIKHNINIVDYSDIYRVYRDDNLFTLKQNYIYSYDNFIYNKDVINYIHNGDIVMADFYNDTNSILYRNYFTILKRKGDKVLGLLENIGGNDIYEDIIIEFSILNINSVLRDIKESITDEKIFGKNIENVECERDYIINTIVISD